MITNLPTLFNKLQGKELISRPLVTFSRAEMITLIETIIDNLDGGLGWSPPYLKDGNELVIPFTAPKKYRWWQGGQRVKETLDELGASIEVIEKYCDMRLEINKDATIND